VHSALRTLSGPVTYCVQCASTCAALLCSALLCPARPSIHQSISQSISQSTHPGPKAGPLQHSTPTTVMLTVQSFLPSRLSFPSFAVEHATCLLACYCCCSLNALPTLPSRTLVCSSALIGSPDGPISHHRQTPLVIAHPAMPASKSRQSVIA
jgi:hypothetical protein